MGRYFISAVGGRFVDLGWCDEHSGLMFFGYDVVVGVLVVVFIVGCGEDFVE